MADAALNETILKDKIVDIGRKPKGKVVAFKSPEKFVFDPSVPVQEQSQVVVHSTNKPTGLRLFFGNITSLSKVSQRYFEQRSFRNTIIAACESHVQDSTVTRLARGSGKTPYINTPQKANVGTHGGEFVLVPNHFNSCAIDQAVLDTVQETFAVPIRFAGTVVRVTGMAFLLCIIYLKVGEGCSEHNFKLLAQARAVAKILKLPLVLVGDFNITLTEIEEAGWGEKLGLRVVVPKDVSKSTRAVGGRLIDYAMVSHNMDTAFLLFKQISGVPWAPHFGYVIQFNLQIAAVGGWTIKRPRDLPLEEAKEWLQKSSPEMYEKLYKEAKVLATDRLAKQKEKTGHAILGKLNSVSACDRKLAHIWHEAHETGEDLAQASLAAEYFMLMAATTPTEEWPRYIGRGQFPKFVYHNKVCGLIQEKDRDLTDEAVQWAQARNSLKDLRNWFTEGFMHQVTWESLMGQIESLIVSSSSYFPKPEDGQGDAFELMKALIAQNPDEIVFDEMKQGLNRVYDKIVNKISNDSRIEYRNFLRTVGNGRRQIV